MKPTGFALSLLAGGFFVASCEQVGDPMPADEEPFVESSEDFTTELENMAPPRKAPDLADLMLEVPDDEIDFFEEFPVENRAIAPHFHGYYQNTRLIDLALDWLAGYPWLFEVVTLGTSTQGEPVRAVHVRVPWDLTTPRPDDAERPVLLVECNMHGREWGSAEACTRFLEKLGAAWVTYPYLTAYYLQNVRLYVVPVVNPDGRNIDDDWYTFLWNYWSDPTAFWTETTYHTNDGSGWRANRSIVECPGGPIGGTHNMGIDLARNFSDGWGGAPTNCFDNKFRGNYPFQAPESNLMRELVNNRMISMAVHVHSFSGTMNTINQADTGPAMIRDNFIDVWNDALAGEPAFDYTVMHLGSDGPSGSGVGQYSSWVARPSDVSGAHDEGTMRGLNSFMLELPPRHDGTYYGTSYQFASGDGSNKFHPSTMKYIEQLAQAFIPALAYMIKQAEYPWCDIDPATLTPNGCADVGLTGSKIAPDTHELGVLAHHDDGTSSDEWTAAGTYGAVYRVQNFYQSGGDKQADVTVVVESWDSASSTWIVENTFNHTHTLAPGAAKVGEASDSLFTYKGGTEYRVTITLTTPGYQDNVSWNDEHVFRFRVK